ncbi:MAG: (d)CMP kinase [archaeon]
MERKKTKTIAIDGPARSGKTTIAKLISKKTGFLYLNTGALYRAIAIYVIQNNIDLTTNDELVKSLSNIEITVEYNNSQQITFLNGKNVTDKVNTDLTSDYASRVSSVNEVREKLINLQRDLANQYNLVIEGRDIGTNVIPDAFLKIYLDANVEERALRRYTQYKQSYLEQNKDIKELTEELQIRDKRDKTRPISPLRPDIDSIIIDTTNKSIKQVLNIILKEFNKKEGLIC